MLSALRNEEWFLPSYSFSRFKDMDSEIAELRTMTKVTKLRQQIECRQEGAWMVVRDVPDLKSKSGTRKVTSFGRTSRSVTRSVSQNFTGKALFDNIDPDNIVVEHPPDIVEEKENGDNNSVEITEVIEEPPYIEPEGVVTPKTVPVKKTSVVTLGKGNLVLINDEDSNFQVTGISKGRVADAVSTLERVSQGEKKVKKVGFCKTEVHFAPDSGRVKIVETDEKPPPTQILRKKKRGRIKTNKSNDLPKLYFGNPYLDESKSAENAQLPHSDSDKEIFSVKKQSNPLLTEVTPSQINNYTELTPSQIDKLTELTPSEIDKMKEEKTTNYGCVKKISKLNSEVKCEEKQSLPYLGNVSPKLSKLLQNNLQHEFQVKQKQIMKSNEPTYDCPHPTVAARESVASKPLKVVTQVSLGEGKGEVEHKFVLKSNDNENEPIYMNREIGLKNAVPVNKSTSVVKEKIPKPRPRTTIVISPHIKEPRNGKLFKQPEKGVKRVISKPKENSKKENNQLKPTVRQNTKIIIPSNLDKRPVKCDISSASSKLQKLIKNGPSTEKTVPEPRVRKVREPLRSFEKVSNGWVGHCIIPVKKPADVVSKSTQVHIATKVANKAGLSTHIQGTKRKNISGNKNLGRSRVEEKSINRTALTENKQFSLSKEHLRSAKLVKELAQKERHTVDKLSSKSQISSVTYDSSTRRSNLKTDNIQNSGNKQTPKVGVVKPRVVSTITSNKNSSVAVRIGSVRTEHSLLRQRRDSDQSDDSVVRADEEVRAYMFNARHKVLNAEYGPQPLYLR